MDYENELSFPSSFWLLFLIVTEIQSRIEIGSGSEALLRQSTVFCGRSVEVFGTSDWKSHVYLGLNGL